MPGVTRCGLAGLLDWLTEVLGSAQGALDERLEVVDAVFGPGRSGRGRRCRPAGALHGLADGGVFGLHGVGKGDAAGLPSLVGFAAGGRKYHSNNTAVVLTDKGRTILTCKWSG